MAGTPENPSAVQSLLGALAALQRQHDAIYAEIGDRLAKTRELDADMEKLKEVLRHLGYRFEASSTEDPKQPKLNIVAAPATNEVAQAGDEKPTLNDVVAEMIGKNGPADTARRVCEWLVRTDQIKLPTVVRTFFELFPPVLREQYNADEAVALEAFRNQLRSWVAKGHTFLDYDRGSVYAKTETETA